MALQRTVATPQALQAAQQMQKILTGSLLDDIKKLEQQAQTLSDSNNWDGVAANHFRTSIWPEKDKQLKQCEQALEQLRQHVEKVIDDIMRAGAEAL